MKQQPPIFRSIEQNLKDLKTLIEKLKQKKNSKERLEILHKTAQVHEFLDKRRN